MIALTQPVFPKPVVYLNAFFILFFFYLAVEARPESIWQEWWAPAKTGGSLGVNDPSMAAGGLNTKNLIALTTAALPTSASFMSLLGFLIEFRTHMENAETSHSCSGICLCLMSQSPSQRSLKDYLSNISWLAFPGAILLYKEIRWIELLISLRLASHNFKSDWWFWEALTAAGHFKML